MSRAPIKNDGEDAQDEFDRMMRAAGAYVYKIEDQKALVGLNRGKRIGSRHKPCDRLVVKNGTHFAEVKSTHDKTAFRFGQLEPTQHGYAKLIMNAGGDYIVYVKNMNTGDWFEVHYYQIHHRMVDGIKSIRWDELKNGDFFWRPSLVS